MGLETSDAAPQTPQPVQTPGTLNFLSIRAASLETNGRKSAPLGSNGEGGEPARGSENRETARTTENNGRKSGEQFQVSSKSNFAGLPEIKNENRSLDLSAPIYPSETKPETTRLNRSRSTSDTTEPPKNKYEIAVTEQLSQLASEAAFTPFTQAALNRDADRFPPVRNAQDGTTTYTIEQIGITDRDLAPGATSAEHFKRLVNITVPDNATSLKECKFDYKDRQPIDAKQFEALVDHAQKRQSDLSDKSAINARLTDPKDVSFYTHGIRTGAEDADFMALALQLTNGHSVVNVDWKSTAVRDETYGLQAAYDINRRGAAESYPKFEKVLDQAISHIGADQTDMIAFSHGAMFDTKYLQHRKETNATLIDEVILAHPDVKCSAMAPTDATGKVADADRLYASVARHAYVIGATNDLAMSGAAWSDSESAPKGSSIKEKWAFQNKQLEIHARLGNGGEISRRLVAGHGGTYVMETTPQDKKDSLNHFVNMAKINSLMNKREAELKLSSLERSN